MVSWVPWLKEKRYQTTMKLDSGRYVTNDLAANAVPVRAGTVEYGVVSINGGAPINVGSGFSIAASAVPQMIANIEQPRKVS